MYGHLTVLLSIQSGVGKEVICVLATGVVVSTTVGKGTGLGGLTGIIWIGRLVSSTSGWGEDQTGNSVFSSKKSAAFSSSLSISLYSRRDMLVPWFISGSSVGMGSSGSV